MRQTMFSSQFVNIRRQFSLALAFCLFLLPTALFSQVAPAISLLADSIILNEGTGTLIASGNVQVFYEGRVVSAAEIRYNRSAGTITATGPIVITDPDGTSFVAEFAELAPDLQNGVIRGARLLLADQLQMSSAEIRRSDNRFNSMNNVVASSCKVCASNPTPVWQIRAQQVVHDDEEKQIYFRNATLEVLGLPVAYLPYLRVPSPEVRRATGFLVPVFLSSDTIGNGVKIPYFVKLGDHADATITPTLTFDGALTADAEYRKRFRNGGIDLFGAVAVDDGQGVFGRGFFSASGAFLLSNDVELSFDGTTISDRSFLKQFGYDDADRIVSHVELSKFQDRNYFSVVGAILLSLRDDEANDEIPVVLPEFTYRIYHTDRIIGSKVAYELSGVGLTREVGQDVARIGGSAEWTVPLEFAHGIRATGFSSADLDFYRVWGNPLFPDRVLTRLNATVGAELRWPLARSTENARHIFEPVAQLVYTFDPDWNDDVPNEDSLQVEFDETNLFNLSRYPGHDAVETEFRANLGATYTIYNDSGWQFGIASGLVLRSDVTSQLSQGFLGAVSLEYPDRFRAIGRFLFDQEFVAKRSEAEFDLSFDQWDVGGSLVYLLADPLAGSTVDRGEGTLDASYRIAPNWEIDMNWTRDFVSGSNVRAGGGVTYGNECIEIALSLSRRFTNSNIIPPTTDIDLVVKLAGFGGSSEDKWPATRCVF